MPGLELGDCDFNMVRGRTLIESGTFKSEAIGRSSSGTISLNLCLLFVDPALLRYLMIHELCHGRHMNHSKRFWAMVGRFEANYRKLDKRLGDAWQDVPAWLGVY